MGVILSFKGYYGFLGFICVCINNEVVYGIFNKKKVIWVGDVLKVDIGVYYEEFYGDFCIIIGVVEVVLEVVKLICVVEEVMFKGIE